MSDGLLPPSMDYIPGTGFDHFGEDDSNYEDLTITMLSSMAPSLNIEIGAVENIELGAVENIVLGATGDIVSSATHSAAELKLRGRASIKIRAFGMLKGEIVQPSVRITIPPRLWWGWLARTLMSKKQYRQHWDPIIADMLEEYYECIAEGDEAAATRAVIRHNLSAIPRWVKLLVVSTALRIFDWLKGS